MNELYLKYNNDVVELYNLILNNHDSLTFKDLNAFVMQHTYNSCKHNKTLIGKINFSISNQMIIYTSDAINTSQIPNPNMTIKVSKSRSFDAAKKYKGKKIAVLDFANNRHPGGGPWSAGAQEESLCRCSTLYPCLKNATGYYENHWQKLKSHEIDMLGNDDIIYIPSVTVFKNDDFAPTMLEEDDWYDVDVIAAAAPELQKQYADNVTVERVLNSRIKRILDIADYKKVQVLILGAFGCGAFKNPPEIVSTTFKKLIKNYSFECVEFAIFGRKNDNNYTIFKKELMD